MSDSPLSVELPAALIDITSAESRLAASSNDDDVRVELSKNTLTTVRPRRVGSFLTSRSPDRLEARGEIEQPLDVRLRQVVATTAGGAAAASGSSRGVRHPSGLSPLE